MIQIYYTKLKGVWYGVAVQDKQVVATCFSVEKHDLNRLQSKRLKAAPFQILEEPDQFSSKVLSALEGIFNGKDRETYEFKMATGHLSDYTRKVLNCTRLIPVGYVTSYGAIAKAVGGNARSVGRVEASNPFPLLIPCHRVVHSDLSIGGYGYGEKTKRAILHREERGCKESMRLKVNDGELALFPVEWVKQKQGEPLRG